MSPLKKLRRQWLRFMADQNWDADSALYRQANEVLMWIEKLIENVGYDCEAWMRGILAEKIATFSQSWTVRRG